MNKDSQFYQVLVRIENGIKRMNEQAAAVRWYLEADDIGTAYDKALKLEAVTEKTTLLTRVLPAYTGHPRGNEMVEEIIVDSVPVEMGFTAEGWFCLRMPKSSSDGRLEGFSFRITGENYDEIFKTDANGEIYIEGLRIGKYTVAEVENEVSAGYKRPAPVEVELVADETLTVNVHNDKITIEESPKTGDNSNIGLWFGLLGLSCLGMVGTVIYGRRRKREELEG